MKAKSSCKKKGGLGWEGLQKGKERGLDNGALSGGVGSRLPPKHEVSMPVNEKPEMKQVVSSNGERACRYRSHGRQTRSAYIFSVSNTDVLFDQSFNPFLPVDSPLFRRW